MEKKIKCCLIFAIILLQSGSVLSQRQTDLSSMQVNKVYKIVLVDNKEVFGKFISADQSGINIETNDKIIMTIPKEKISFYTTNLAPGKYTFSASLSGGASFLRDKYYPYEGTSGNMMCLNLNLAGMLFLSDSKAIGIDAGYTNLKAANSLSATSLPPYYTSVSGGDVMLLSIKGSFILGRFRPEEKFLFYGALGFGVHFASRDVITLGYNYQPYDTAQFVGSGTQKVMSTVWINPMISVGGTAGYKFSGRFGIKAELEYIMLLGSGESMFSGNRNYLPLRAGIFYIF